MVFLDPKGGQESRDPAEEAMRSGDGCEGCSTSFGREQERGPLPALLQPFYLLLVPRGKGKSRKAAAHW